MLTVAGLSSKGVRAKASHLAFYETFYRYYSLSSSSSTKKVRLFAPKATNTRASSSKQGKAYTQGEHSKPSETSWNLRDRLQKLTSRVFPGVAPSAQYIPSEADANRIRPYKVAPRGKIVDVNLKLDHVKYPSRSRTPQSTSSHDKFAGEHPAHNAAAVGVEESIQKSDPSKQSIDNAAKSSIFTSRRKRKAERRRRAYRAELKSTANAKARSDESVSAVPAISKQFKMVASKDDQMSLRVSTEPGMGKDSIAEPFESMSQNSVGNKARRFAQPHDAYEEWADIMKTLNVRQTVDRDIPPHVTNEEDIAKEDEQETKSLRTSSSSSHRHSHRSDVLQGELIRGASIPRYREIMPTQESELNNMTMPGNYLPIDLPSSFDAEKRRWWDQEAKWSWTVGGRLSALAVPLTKVRPLREMQVPQLAHGLDRVLFNPGVHWLRDSRSGIYNYEPRLRDIYDVDLFDYSALPAYVTSSKDAELAEIARRDDKRYTGSTSSMTALLSQIYFLISAWKQPDLSGFSSGFSTLPKTFSYGAKLPACIYLRRFEETLSDGKKLVRYAIDADKSAEGSDNNNYVLTQLGKSVEKLLTSKPEEYEKYLRINSHLIGPEEKEKKEAYHYATSGKLLMRSQLDCSDERLPRKTFDLKTRAVIAVRQDRANWVESSGYLIRHATGIFESFEREMWDMTRATLLKYYFQAKIGHMDGILVAYHSTATMFGFQYLPCEDMAMKLFGSVEMGEQAFRLTLGMLEKILDMITDIKPSSTLKITLDTEPGHAPKMLAFAQAVDESGMDVDVITSSTDPSKEEEKAAEDKGHQLHPEKKLLQFDIRVDRYLGGDLVRGPVDFSLPNGYRINVASEDEITRRKRASLPPLEWSIEYSITPRSDLGAEATAENLQKIMGRKEGLAPLVLPNLEALNERERLREQQLSVNETALQKFLEDRRTGAAVGMPAAPGQVSTGEGRTIPLDDGDAKAASANLEEAQSQLKVEGATEAAPNTQRWKKQTNAIERLRELARLGKQDKDRDALTDLMQIYERRGE